VVSAGCDLLLAGGRVFTQEEERPWAEALAVAGGRILAVGEGDELRPLAGRDTRVIELGGRLVLPGFIDGHIHFRDWALSRRLLPVAGCASREELLAVVARGARRAPEGAWLVGRGLDESLWPEGGLPGLEELDAASRGHPLLLYRRDMHLALANRAALALAGVDRRTPDPPQGRIERDARGEPTGVLRETAVHLVGEAVPPPGRQEVLEAMESAQAHLHRLGVTGVHDMRIMGGVCGRPGLRAWQELRRRGRLALRVWCALPGEELEALAGLGLESGLGDGLLRLGHLKLFADGSVGARTAWMLEPYRDTGTCGMPLLPAEELVRRIARAQEAGLAVAVHAIGDRALRELIAAWSGLPPSPLAVPHRIEHVQMLRAEEVAPLARLGVTASVQPVHLADDMAMMPAAVGDGSENAYRFAQMLAAGVPLCFGSDAPVSDPNPLLGLKAAVLRQDHQGRPSGGWYPEQRLSLARAVAAYTLGPARAAGWEGELGSLRRGKRADLVVLDRDIFRRPPQELDQARVEMTLFEGRVVYLRRGSGLGG